MEFTIAVIPKLWYAYHQGYANKLNSGGKGNIHQQCTTRYKSKAVKLIERYDEWRS
jgi:hypothetical protein